MPNLIPNVFANATVSIPLSQLDANFAVCVTGPSTRQVLTSGSAATYTTPANCSQLRIRMVGGGAGEYVEWISNSPAGTYTYTVGASAAGGTGITNGGAGGSGIIIIDEIY